MDIIKRDMSFVPFNALVLAGITLFVFFPFLGCAILVLFFLVSPRELKYGHFVVFAIILALYLGLLNTTKTVEGDQLNYQFRFLSVDGVRSFGMYLKIVTEKRFEFFYYLVNYVAYHAFGGNYKLFVLLLTCLIYIPQFMVVISILYKNNKNYIVPTLLLIAFFYTTFRTSIHLARQYLGEALIIYVLLRRNLNYFVRTLGALIAFSTHTINGIFIPFVLFPTYKLRIWQIVLFVASGFVLARLVLVKLASYFMGTSVGVFNYVGNRLMSQKSDGIEFNQTLIVVITTVVICLLLVLLFQMRHRQVTRAYNLVYLMLLMVVIVFNSQNVMQYRVFMAMYMLFPFLLMFIVMFYRKRWVHFGYMTIALFCYFHFHFTLNRGTFNYISLEDFVFMSIFEL